MCDNHEALLRAHELKRENEALKARVAVLEETLDVIDELAALWTYVAMTIPRETPEREFVAAAADDLRDALSLMHKEDSK